MRDQARWTWMAAVFTLLAAARSAFHPFYDVDLWWHIAQGREALVHGLVHDNRFSAFHAAYPQAYTSWLFEVAVAGADAAAGALGLQLAHFLLALLTVGAWGAACTTAGGRAPALAVVLLGFSTVDQRVMLRPHVVSMACLALLSCLAARAVEKADPAPLRWAVPLMLAWGNAHAEVVLGVGWLVLLAAGTVWRGEPLHRRHGREMTLIALAAGVAALCTPYGTGVLESLAMNSRVGETIRIAELLQPNVNTYAAFMAWSLVVVALMVAMPSRLQAWEVPWLLGLGWLAWSHVRFVSTAVLGSSILVAWRVRVLFDEGFNARAAWLACGLAGFGLGARPVSAWFSRPVFGAPALHMDTMLPVRAAAVATELGLEGPVFCGNNIGGYITYAMWPRARVFQDSRLQAYPAGHFRGIMDASRDAQAWAQLVEGVDWAILSLPRANELSGVGRFNASAWATVYWDEASQVLVRRTGAFAHVARAHGMDAFLPGASARRMAPETRARAREEALRFADGPRLHVPALLWLCEDGDAQRCRDAWMEASRHPVRDDVRSHLLANRLVPPMPVAADLPRPQP